MWCTYCLTKKSYPDRVCASFKIVPGKAKLTLHLTILRDHRAGRAKGARRATEARPASRASPTPDQGRFHYAQRELRHLRHRRLETIHLCTVQLLPSPIANPSLQGPHLSIRKASRVATLQVLKKGLGRLGRIDLKPQPELLPDFRKRILSSPPRPWGSGLLCAAIASRTFALH